MGRTEPSLGRPPAGFRRDVRAKRAKATANKVIPSVLSAHPRARRGVDAAELIVDPPPAAATKDGEGPISQKSQRQGHERGPAGPLRISMRVADTLRVAHSLLSPRPSTASARQEESRDQNQASRNRKGPGSGPDLGNRTARVGILNMASPLSPDGGFLNGSAGGDSSLCLMRTTLLPSLRDVFYRLPELSAVYTPDVLVFRRSGDVDDAENEDDMLPKSQRWFVDCISAAMLRLPETQEVAVEAGSEDQAEVNDINDGSDSDDEAAAIATTRKVYADPADRELVLRKMRVVLRVAQAKGIKKLVLGAWGCGAYGNPVEEIAAAWQRVLLGGSGGRACARTNHDNNNNIIRQGDKSNGRHKSNNKKSRKAKETWDGIEEVVFAIRSAGVAERFAKAFGDALVWDEDEPCLEDMEKDDDNDDVRTRDQNGEEDPELRQLRELRQKIQHLELQAQQARTPRLRSGLDAVLAGLKSQLPEEENEEENGTASPNRRESSARHRNDNSQSEGHSDVEEMVASEDGSESDNS